MLYIHEFRYEMLLKHYQNKVASYLITIISVISVIDCAVLCTLSSKENVSQYRF